MAAVVLCFWLVLFGCAMKGRDGDDSIAYPSPCNDAYCILDSSQALLVNKLPGCTRNAPTVEGGWQMSADEAKAFDSLVLNLEVPCQIYENDGRITTEVLKPDEYYRQYVGVIYEGRRMVYVNATRGKLSEELRSQLESVCDGGAFQWGALWDPVKKEFSYVECNAQG